jgi:hypothetical protein
MKKLTYDYVKSFFEQEGYKLLSTEYTDNHKYLDVICPVGHKWSVQFYAFKNGNRCYECSPNKHISKEKALKIIEDKGFTVIQGEYKNTRSILTVKCKNGHVSTKKFCNIQKYGCYECSGIKRKTYDDVKNEIEKRGFVLLSTTYKNNRTKLKIKCQCGNIFLMTYNCFSTGCGCPKCRVDNIMKTKIKKGIISYETNNDIRNFYIKFVRAITYMKYKKIKGMSLDHIYPVSWGYENKISPYVLINKGNIQYITPSENSKKRNKITVSMNELFDKTGYTSDKNLYEFNTFTKLFNMDNELIPYTFNKKLKNFVH